MESSIQVITEKFDIMNLQQSSGINQPLFGFEISVQQLVQFGLMIIKTRCPIDDKNNNQHKLILHVQCINNTLYLYSMNEQPSSCLVLEIDTSNDINPCQYRYAEALTIPLIYFIEQIVNLTQYNSNNTTNSLIFIQFFADTINGVLDTQLDINCVLTSSIINIQNSMKFQINGTLIPIYMPIHLVTVDRIHIQTDIYIGILNDLSLYTKQYTQSEGIMFADIEYGYTKFSIKYKKTKNQIACKMDKRKKKQLKHLAISLLQNQLNTLEMLSKDQLTINTGSLTISILQDVEQCFVLKKVLDIRTQLVIYDAFIAVN